MIIKSLLDNDLYKFSMQNAVITLFPRAKVRYKFINRANTIFPNNFDNVLKDEILKMSSLKADDEQLNYFQQISYYLPPTYFDFLRGYRYNPDEVKIELKDGKLDVTIEGYWYRTILWEVPLLALISELYFRETNQPIWEQNTIKEVAAQKAQFFAQIGANFADFGTRRRYSAANQDMIVATLKQNASKNFVGTSNVYFAYKFGLTPIGTQAHEWIMFHAAKYGLLLANKLSV